MHLVFWAGVAVALPIKSLVVRMARSCVVSIDVSRPNCRLCTPRGAGLDLSARPSLPKRAHKKRV